MSGRVGVPPLVLPLTSVGGAVRNEGVGVTMGGGVIEHS